MKKNYQKPILTPFSFEIEGPVLDASLTSSSIDPDVSVDPYGNGFDDPTLYPGGFNGITFD